MVYQKIVASLISLRNVCSTQIVVKLESDSNNVYLFNAFRNKQINKHLGNVFFSKHKF